MRKYIYIFLNRRGPSHATELLVQNDGATRRQAPRAWYPRHRRFSAIFPEGAKRQRVGSIARVKKSYTTNMPGRPKGVSARRGALGVFPAPNNNFWVVTRTSMSRCLERCRGGSMVEGGRVLRANRPPEGVRNECSGCYAFGCQGMPVLSVVVGLVCGGRRWAPRWAPWRRVG